MKTRTILLEEVPYRPDSCDLFEQVRDLPNAAFLDSAYPHSLAGRFDIITAAPVDHVEMPQLGDNPGEDQCREYFAELSRFLAERYAGIQPAGQELPFCGGVLGYISYDFGNMLQGISSPGAQSETVTAPPLALRAYDWCLIQDHLLRRSVLVTQAALGEPQRKDLLARMRRPKIQAVGRFALQEPFAANLSVDEYRSAFERIQAYIQAGDCYQVNLAQRFTAACSGDSWQAYRRLRGVAAAPFSAYLELPETETLMSFSPERFLSLHGHRVETSPIKGTRPRHRDSAADRLAADELRGSEKDRAENLMIVDLLRNDLGRSCVPGSIHVDRLFELQSFATVHHLVSTISGELRPERGACELLLDSFPGGSITGAPKRRAMQIIAELEPHARRSYCGSVVYISADGRMDSNIAIRSLLCQADQLHCWGGGGIVADSQWQLEYQETYDKVGRLLNALETMGSE